MRAKVLRLRESTTPALSRRIWTYLVWLRSPQTRPMMTKSVLARQVFQIWLRALNYGLQRPSSHRFSRVISRLGWNASSSSISSKTTKGINRLTSCPFSNKVPLRAPTVPGATYSQTIYRRMLWRLAAVPTKTTTSSCSCVRGEKEALKMAWSWILKAASASTLVTRCS